MNVLLAAVLLWLSWSAVGPGPLDGLATYMNPGRMEGAAAYHRLALDGADIFVALNDCRHIGRLVWLEREDEVLAARVADCAQARHRAKRESQGYVAEVGYETALEWGIAGVGPTPVRVWFFYPFLDLGEGLSCELRLDFRCY